MNTGKILVSEWDGSYLVKLCGDVRVTLCTSLDRYIGKIFGSGDVCEVIVDLQSAQGVDSTTLGLLAKLGIHCNRQFGIRPKAFYQGQDLCRLLETMSLDQVFDIYRSPMGEPPPMEELAAETEALDGVRQRVIEAHRLLLTLNPEKESEFLDLLEALEQEQGVGG